MTFGDKILEGKVAFVAGGTRGMNLAIARRYAQHGAKVCVMSRDPERVQRAVKSLQEDAPADHIMGLPGDVREYERLETIYGEVEERFGKLDIVVAGQAGNFYAPATHMSSKGFRTIIDIDLIGSFNVFRAAWEHLNRPGAALLAITAPEAVRPLHFQAHVCAAKAGLNMLIKCLAIEWGPQGVRVNGISPGPIEGSWGMKFVASPSQEIVDKITKAIPLKRWGKVEDIADSALFLSSSAASYITGTILETDGGVTIASPEGAELDSLSDLASDTRVRRASKDDRAKD
ncbi:MAG: NAD(P)-dependent dehydrogenase (short-subunit alcohol dehydrogenase family) [Myxococcota bacterium]|jgi:NAD(P)-dependent dehydrogenase (short-subunit alcohol dehydrogenase family)